MSLSHFPFSRNGDGNMPFLPLRFPLIPGQARCAITTSAQLDSKNSGRGGEEGRYREARQRPYAAPQFCNASVAA